MTTQTKPKTQELESKTDLLLLLKGDFVNINILDYDGIAKYLGEGPVQGYFNFRSVEEKGQKYHYYPVRFDDALIVNNKIKSVII